jgi:nicotinamide-nucleotide amidase
MGGKVVYAVPGVPAEMRDMVDGDIIADLVRRSGETATILSRFVRVWGVPESKVAEIVAPRIVALEHTSTTIAFLASITEGVRVRVTTRATGPDAQARAVEALDAEEAELRALLGSSVGGVDDEGLETTVGGLLKAQGYRLALAESLTAGMVSARLGSVPGASEWLAGGVVSYGGDVKRDLLGVGPGPVVSSEAAAEMAAGVARLLSADVGLALTGVAGPTGQDGQPVGTVFVAVHLPVRPGSDAGPGRRVVQLALSGDRQMVRERAVTSALDFLRDLLLHDQ